MSLGTNQVRFIAAKAGEQSERVREAQRTRERERERESESLQRKGKSALHGLGCVHVARAVASAVVVVAVRACVYCIIENFYLSSSLSTTSDAVWLYLFSHLPPPSLVPTRSRE